MRVHIQSDRLCQPLTLEMEPTDTIHRLKAGIRRRIFFTDADCLLLLDGRNLIELDGSTTLDKSGIKDEASLQVGYNVNFMVCVKAHAYGDLFIEVKCFETIGDLKGKIYRWMGVPVKDQLLEWNNVFYNNDSSTLFSCGIFKTLFRSRPQHIIFLNPTSKNIESFKRTPKIPMTTLRVLNEAKEAGLSVKEFLQTDRFRNLSPPIYPDKDNPSVKELQISVEIPNMPWRFPLTVKPTYTIAVVRDVILHEYYKHEELFGQRYIENGLFVLFRGRKRLKDDSITVDKCGIRHTGCIQLFEKASFPIAICPPLELGLGVHIRVNCFDTIGKLKEKLQVMTGIPPEKQQLTYLDWCLDDEKRLLVDYGIVKAVKYDEPHGFKTSKKRPFRNHRQRKLFINLLISTDESVTARCNADKAGWMI